MKNNYLNTKIILLVTSILLISKIYSEERYPLIYPKNQGYKLQKDHLLKDMDRLAYVFSQSYGGYSQTKQKLWDQGFLNIKNEIESFEKNIIPSEKFIEIFKQNLGSYLDKHFMIKTKDSTGRSIFNRVLDSTYAYQVDESCQKWLSNTPKIKEKFFTYDLKNFDTKPIFLMTERDLTKLVPFDPKKCSKKISRSAPHDPSISFKELGDWKYVKIGSFFSKEYFDNYEEVFSNLNSNDQIILDLRGNGGGNSDYILKKLRSLGINEKYSYGKKLQFETKVSVNMQIEYFKRVIKEEKDIEHNKTALKHYRDRKNKPFIPPYLNLKSNDLEKHDIEFSGKIVVIVGNNCGSACESVVDMLRRSNNATILGSNTSGANVTGEMVQYTLANTKLSVSIPLQFYPDISNDPDFKEGRGFFPDYWIDVNKINLENIEEIANRAASDKIEKNPSNNPINPIAESLIIGFFEGFFSRLFGG